MSKQNQYEKYKQKDDVLLPEFDKVLKNEHKLPYIFLNGRKHYSFINQEHMEQSYLIKSQEEISNRKNTIHEQYLYKNKLKYRIDLDVNNFRPNHFSKIFGIELFETKSRDLLEFNVNL